MKSNPFRYLGQGGIKVLGASRFALIAAAFIVSGFFAPQTAFAAHSATVTVTPSEVAGADTDTYTFQIATDPASANFVWEIRITAPAGFTVSEDVICPDGWAISATASEVRCVGDPDPGQMLGLQPGDSESVTFGATAATPGSDEHFEWTVQTRDNAFTSQVNNPTTLVDITPPTTTLAADPEMPDGEAGWYGSSPVVISLQAEDGVGSGVDATYYTTDEGIELSVETGTLYEGAFTVSDEGVTTVRFFSVDSVGNVEEVQTATIQVDTAAPVTTDNLPEEGQWVRDVFSVELTLNDPEPGSGVGATYYTTDSNIETLTADNGTLYEGPFTIEVPGIHAIRYFSVDVAGNQEAVQTATLQIDMADPVTEFTADPPEPFAAGNWYNTDTGKPTITLTCSDELSGCASISYRFGDQGEFTSVTELVGNSVTLSGEQVPEGELTLQSFSTDRAGNEGSPPIESESFKVDTQAPELDPVADVVTNEDFTLVVAANDPEPGSGNLTYSWVQVSGPTDGTINFGDDGAQTTTVSTDAEGEYEIRVTVTDEAGNSSSETLTFIWDTTPPAITPIDDKIAGQEVTLIAEGTDQSGITSYHWSQESGPGTITFGDLEGQTTMASADEDGVYGVEVTVTDQAGNVASAGFNFTWDTVAPTIDSFVSPGEDNVYLPGDEIVLAFTPNDETTGVTCSYAINNGTPVSADCTLGQPVEVTINAESLLDGRQDLVVTATDEAGNFETAVVSFVLNSDETLRVSPDVGPDQADFESIQAAIDRASAGDTIRVAAGTYTGDLRIEDAENLKLVGESGATIKGETLVDDAAGYYADEPNILILAEGTEISGFTVETPAAAEGQHAVVVTIGAANATITENHFRVAPGTQSDAPSVAIVTYCDTTSCPGNPAGVDISGLLIQGNTFTSLDGSGSYESVYLNPDLGSGTVSVEGNTFEGKLHRAVANERPNVTITGNEIGTDLPVGETWQGIAVVNWYNDDISHVTIADNTIDGMKTGVRLAHSGEGWSPTGALSNITLSQNTFSNNETGVHVYRSADQVTLSGENVFDGNTVAVRNDDAASVDATENYWGTAIAAAVESITAGEVSFAPYYVDGDMELLSTTAPGAVFVDPTFTDDEAGGKIFGYNAFDAIQEGISAVAEGGTVEVAAGTYAEPVGTCGGQAATFCIDKALTITGDPGSNTEVGPGATAPIVDGGGANASAFVIASGVSNVTIEGFEIRDFANPGNTGGVGSAILSWNTGAANITIQDNYLHGLGWNGVLAGSDNGSSQSGWLVQRNVIEGAAYAAVELTNVVQSTVSDNVITVSNGNWDAGDSGVGVEIAVRAHADQDITGGTGVTVSRNTISGAGSNARAGLNLLARAYTGSSVATLSGATVAGNTITNNNTRGVYIVAESRNGGAATVEELTHEGNTLDNNSVGIKFGLDGATHSNGTYDVGTIVFDKNRVAGNEAGLANNVAETTVDARGNWWGDSSGPAHASSPLGTGDSVSDGVLFRPWYTTAAMTDLDENAPAVTVDDLIINERTPTITGTVSDESPVTVTVTVENETYEAAVANGGWTAEVTDELADGTYALEVLAEDQAGNQSTSSGILTIDTASPELTAVSISTSNENAGWAKVDDTITVTFTANKKIAQVTVTIADNPADDIQEGEANQWTATYVMTEQDDEGEVSFSITFEDLAGNPEDLVNTTDDESSVTFDKTAPDVSIGAPVADARVNGNAVIEIATTDEDGVITCSVDGGESAACDSGVTTIGTVGGFDALPQGEFTLWVRHADDAGNIATASVNLVKDTIAPMVVSHTPGINAVNVEGNTITIEFSAAVNIEVGQVTLAPVVAYSVGNSGTDTITLTTEPLESNTVYTVTITTGVEDLAGNPMEEEYSWQFTTATLYNIPLYSTAGGWNLMSLPVVPNDQDIEAVLGSAASSVEAVWTYDPTHPNAVDGWLVYTGDSETSNLDIMTAGFGYWISATSDTTISGSGSLLSVGPTAPPSRDLVAGWNLIGYYQIPGENSSTRSQAFASIGKAGTDYTSLWGFNNSTGQLKSTITEVLPGEAFWIALPSAKTYLPSNLLP